jgi:crotonobetainyl-CoA:carnitine CoA-transferase CaiB-like acyl-CoA transferase
MVGFFLPRRLNQIGDDPRFSSSQDRIAHDSELAQAISAVLARRPASDWESTLSGQDVTCVEVSRGSFSEFTISSPTVRDNEFVAEVVHPLFGSHLRHGPMATFSATPGSPGPGCLVGQHTRAVLLELGYTDDQIADLQTNGVVHCLDEN